MTQIETPQVIASIPCIKELLDNIAVQSGPEGHLRMSVNDCHLMLAEFLPGRLDPRLGCQNTKVIEGLGEHRPWETNLDFVLFNTAS